MQSITHQLFPLFSPFHLRSFIYELEKAAVCSIRASPHITLVLALLRRNDIHYIEVMLLPIPTVDVIMVLLMLVYVL